MSPAGELDALLDRYVERHVLHGERTPAEELCGGRAELVEPLRRLIDRYHRLDDTMSRGAGPGGGEAPAAADGFPKIDGCRVIERLGRGGMGDVYKVHDLKLDRVVAAKVLRRDSPAAASYGGFVGEARSMALFRDRRIVQVHEYRAGGEAPVILMEHVEGFPLHRLAPSLDWRQRARILVEVCEAIQHAHDLGIQHRDLKPANILLDASLTPRILDFGLAGGDPRRGHLVGTPAYMAPEQLDPTRPIDARSDVWALGVIFYEMLCGERPFAGETDDVLAGAIRAGRPRLPVEIDGRVPEPLQAVALKAMEVDPARRYASAREMALDLRRWLEDRPVLARPSVYSSVLARRLLPHLQEIEEWLRLKLIHPHEARGIREAYERLEQREDDWIVQSRMLSYSQIALYLGGFLLACGALLYFVAHRFFDAVEGLTGPALVLGLPFVGLNVAAHLLYRRERRAVAVAYWLAAALLLPFLLLILFHEGGLWSAAGEGQFFGEQEISNRQLQLALLATCAWACWQAFRTRTIGLSSLSTALLVLFALAVLTDLGLEDWLTEGRRDLLALHLAPWAAALFALGWSADRAGRAWFATPLYAGAALVGAVALELLALDGRALDHLGIHMAGAGAGEAADPTLLDTLTAMSLNGVVFLVAGSLMESRGTRSMRPAAWSLVVVSPFAVLHPLGWLVATGNYSLRYDWAYLGLALAVAVASRFRQRRSFYLAGLLNSGLALYHITEHYEWFDRPGWSIAVVVTGLAALVGGLELQRRESSRRGGAG